MFLWCAIDLDDQMTALKGEVRRVSEELGVENIALGLPFHVSLRISFEVPDEREEEVKASMSEYFSTLRSFRFEPLCMERQSNVVWVRMKDNPKLSRIHEGLCRMLQERFGVPMAEFDRSFIFHSTLAWTADEEGADRIFRKLSDAKVPSSFKAKNFVVGRAFTGKPGDFKVVGNCEIAEDQDDYLM
ncbi:MAG: 2'-5' RNA ligase family protein [Spirochaetales bacterium]|nr:2'-5' RNA ligase family protein [Spirochaetales bacterium]